MNVEAVNFTVARPRRWGAILLFGLFLCGVFVPSQAHADSLSIAVFQVLGIKKKIPQILEHVQSAYKAHAGQSAMATAEMQKRLGDYGLSKFKGCSLLIACFIQKSKQHLGTDATLLLGIGGFGNKVLIDFILLDLKKGQQKKRLSQTFNGMDDMKARLPDVMKKLFPAPKKPKTLLKLEGTPEGADVSIDGEAKGKLPLTLEVKPDTDLKLKITHPKHKDVEQTVNVPAGKTKSLALALPPKAAAVVRVPPRRREPAAGGKAWYQNWWVWAIAGVVVVGTGVAIGVAASSSGPALPELQISF